MEFPQYEEPREDSASPPKTNRRVRSSSVSSTGTVVYDPQPPLNLPVRGRKRSNSFNTEEHPLQTPNSSEEFQLAQLIRSINAENQRAEQTQAQPARQQLTPEAPGRDFTPRAPRGSSEQAQVTAAERARRKAALTESGGYTGNTYSRTELTGSPSQPSYPRSSSGSQPRGGTHNAERQSPVSTSFKAISVDYGFPPLATNEELLEEYQYRLSQASEAEEVRRHSASRSSTSRSSSSHRGSSSKRSRPLPTPPTPSLDSSPFPDFDVPQLPGASSFDSPPTTHRTSYVYPEQSSAEVSRQRNRDGPFNPNMSYQNYLDSPQGNPSQSPRQAPPSPAQNMNPNGMNGGMGMGGGYPTPAGHQQDLNHIMSMVEALSAQLAHNNAMTSNIVEMTGRVREIAQKHNLTNEELIALSAHSLDGQNRNLDKEMSDLQKKFDKASYDREEWKKLSVYCCNVLSNILDLARDFKAKHEADTLAWHKNYRNQLADEREENLKLRCEINDMRAAAIRANGHLNDLRRAISDNKAFHEQEVQIAQWRQQSRFWKRMAMPYLPDDDPEFSDDDDIIDPEEKKRQQAEKEAKEGEDKEGGASTN